MRSTLALLLLTACSNDDAKIEALAQNAAAAAAATLDVGTAPSGLAASDFKIDATLEQFDVLLDDLVAKQAGATLFDTGRRVYIMSASPSYRSAVFLRKSGNTWGVGQFNGSDLASVLGDSLAAVRTAHKADNNTFFYLSIEGMHLNAIGYREKGALMLASIEDRPDLNLTANLVQPASQLFPSLSEAARSWLTESAKFFAPSAR